MANEKNKIDAQFREKLIHHQEKPSALAWERLENQLPKPRQKNGSPFLKIAASLLLLMGMGYFIWFAVDSTSPKIPELAVKMQESLQDPESLPPEETEVLNQEDFPGTKETIPVEKEDSEVVKTQILPPKKEPISPKVEVKQPKLVAGIRKPEENLSLTAPKLPEIGIIELKIAEEPLKETLALVEEPSENENGYRVKIISKGFLAEAEKPGLIGGIETKIEKIGGLLSKVDQGFADLQDAKNNLFASIATKKEKNNQP
jgi:hypothetical protein